VSDVRRRSESKGVARRVLSASVLPCGRLSVVPTALERAIDSLSDPHVALPDALRTLLVVSRRIGAEELTSWINAELDGYRGKVSLPTYREGIDLPVKLQFDSMGMSRSLTVHWAELPDELDLRLKKVPFRHPVAELVELSDGGQDPCIQLPVGWVSQYRELAANGKAPYYEYMTLDHAAIQIPRTYLKGALDRIKTTALDIALSLEDISPAVGTSGGPTVTDDPRLAQQVTINLTQLYADNATVAVGDHATVSNGLGAVSVTVGLGDMVGLLKEAVTGSSGSRV